MSKSYYIKTLLGHTGHAALYVVDPPLGGFDYVVVEAGELIYDGLSLPCTWVTPANERGMPIGNKVLAQIGGNDHTGLLEACGRPLQLTKTMVNYGDFLK